jgi:hypothetical protein
MNEVNKHDTVHVTVLTVNSSKQQIIHITYILNSRFAIHL